MALRMSFGSTKWSHAHNFLVVSYSKQCCSCCVMIWVKERLNLTLSMIKSFMALTDRGAYNKHVYLYIVACFP